MSLWKLNGISSLKKANVLVGITCLVSSSEYDYTHPIKLSMFDSNTKRVREFDFSFGILSLNVRGIRHDTERIKNFNSLKNHTSNQAVVFLQETHSTPDVENLWSNQWQFKEKIISHGEH